MPLVIHANTAPPTEPLRSNVSPTDEKMPEPMMIPTMIATPATGVKDRLNRLVLPSAAATGVDSPSSAVVATMASS